NKPTPSTFPPAFSGTSDSMASTDSFPALRDSFNFDHAIDSQSIHLVLRNILIKLMSDTSAHIRMTITGNDSSLILYHRSIEAALSKKHLVLLDSSAIQNRSDSDFIFRLTSPDMVVPVGGSRTYILKK